MGRRRDLGGLVFIDLRDRSGIVQVVFNPETSPLAHSVAEKLGSEDVVCVSGVVVGRPPGAMNPTIPTGKIDVAAESLEVLSKSKTCLLYTSLGEAPGKRLRGSYCRI